jgi:hypothetical protein
VAPHSQPTDSQEDRHAVWQRLSRLQGPGELRAALLALVRTADSARELQAWREHTRDVASAEAIRSDVAALDSAARLPWFELLLGRAQRQAEADRKGLVDAARKVMAADGKVRPQDRLIWLAIRHGLGDAPPLRMSGDVDNDLLLVSSVTAQAIAGYTAFLARLVPQASVDAGVAAAGTRWYEGVCERCLAPSRRPACVPPDADAMLRALRQLQGLPWMLRPVLARAWVDVVMEEGIAALEQTAADALRLSCRLIESPLPPALASRHVELDVRT